MDRFFYIVNDTLYRSPSGQMLVQEAGLEGASPIWVLRQSNFNYVDHGVYRYDVAERNDIKLVYTPWVPEVPNVTEIVGLAYACQNEVLNTAIRVLYVRFHILLGLCALAGVVLKKPTVKHRRKKAIF